MPRIAVLITCHNRKAKTLACLNALFNNRLPEACSLTVFLVDDGSSDGTDMAVQNAFPEVHIIKGDGRLFWSGGMRKAFQAAKDIGFDYYLWLNDDTMLYDNAIFVLMNCGESQYGIKNRDGIIVGSVVDPSSGKLTYGGNIRQKRFFNQIKMKRADLVSGKVLDVDTMNGNCVLISNAIAEKLGNIDPVFIHGFGDYDYGFRAKAMGFHIWVASEVVATCTHDYSIEGTHKDRTLSVKNRIRHLNSPKGFPRKAWMTYCRRHAGFFWLFVWVAPYLRVLLQGGHGKATPDRGNDA